MPKTNKRHLSLLFILVLLLITSCDSGVGENKNEQKSVVGTNNLEKNEPKQVQEKNPGEKNEPKQAPEAKDEEKNEPKKEPGVKVGNQELKPVSGIKVGEDGEIIENEDEQGSVEQQEKVSLIKNPDDDYSDRDYTDRFYSRVPKVPLSDDWESMEFHFVGMKFDYLGKEFKTIASFAPYEITNDIKVLAPSEAVDVAFIIDDEKTSKKYYFTLTLLNPKDTRAKIEDSTIVAISLNEYGFLKEQGKPSENNLVEGFILPGRIAPGDYRRHVINTYGEPTSIRELGGADDTLFYESKDGRKTLIINEDFGQVQYFIMRLKVDQETALEMNEKTSMDFTKDLTKDSYLNINGVKVKLNSKVKEVHDSLNLVGTEYYNDINFEKSEVDPLELIFKPGEEDKYNTIIPGYEGYRVELKIANLTNKEIKKKDMTVTGIRVWYKGGVAPRLNTPHMPPEPHGYPYVDKIENHLSVVGPYGVKLKEKHEGGISKITGTVNEQSLDEGVKVFEVGKGNMILQGMSAPKEKDMIIESLMIELK